MISNKAINAHSGFSKQWDSKYAANEHMSVWPWSDVVAYTSRFAKPASAFSKVLELGCGAGANIPFFVDRGCGYHAIDGSPCIVAKLHERFPQLAPNIRCGDFTSNIPFNATFDMVVDRAAVTHNDTASIKKCIEKAAIVTRNDGLFIGIDWFSDKHGDSKRGTFVDDSTRQLEDGPYAGTGNVHFSTKEHIQALFESAGFKVVLIEHKLHEVQLDLAANVKPPCVAAFNFVAVRQ